MGVFSTADLRSILGTQSDKPIAWRNSLGMLLSMSVGAGLGLLLDSATGGQTVLISLLTGMFLGLVSVTGPFVMWAMRGSLCSPWSSSHSSQRSGQQSPWWAVCLAPFRQSSSFS